MLFQFLFGVYILFQNLDEGEGEKNSMKLISFNDAFLHLAIRNHKFSLYTLYTVFGVFFWQS